MDARRRRRSAADPLPGSYPDHTDVVEAALPLVEGAAVRTALGTLPQAQRAVVVLAYYGGNTQQEIIVRPRVPLGTVKSRMREALHRLRGALQAVAEDAG